MEKATNKINYILLIMIAERGALRRADFEDYPESQLKKLHDLDLEANDNSNSGVVGWSIYKLDGEYYTLLDGETLDKSTQAELNDYIDGKVNNLFRSQSVEILEVLEKWKLYLSNKEKDLIDYANAVAVKANNSGVFRASMTTKGKIQIDNNSLISANIYDIDKTETELYASVSLEERAKLPNGEEATVTFLFTIYQPLFDSFGEVTKTVSDMGKWYAGLHNMELILM